MGLPPPKAVDGRSLVPLIEGRLADHPKETWTYAASTNEGLVMRWENRLRYVLRDAAWSPLSGSEMLYDLKEDAAATTDVALDRPADAARLRARSLDVLGRQARGLRVQFRNQGTSTIQGLLESSIIEPVTVKAAAASPVPVKWRGMGRPSFELDPWSDFTLIFTNVKHQSVDLRGKIGMDGCPDSVPFALSLSLASLKNPHQTEFDIERCEVQAPTSGRLETGLTIWWIGSRPDESAGPDLDDPNLRRQLEALGYLE